MQVSADQALLMVVKYFMHPFAAVTEENGNCATSTRPAIIISVILIFTLWGPHSYSQPSEPWLMHPFTLPHLASEMHIQKLPRSMAGAQRAPGACLSTAALAACQPWARATAQRGHSHGCHPRRRNRVALVTKVSQNCCLQKLELHLSWPPNNSLY